MKTMTSFLALAALLVCGGGSLFTGNINSLHQELMTPTNASNMKIGETATYVMGLLEEEEVTELELLEYMYVKDKTRYPSRMIQWFLIENYNHISEIICLWNYENKITRAQGSSRYLYDKEFVNKFISTLRPDKVQGYLTWQYELGTDNKILPKKEDEAKLASLAAKHKLPKTMESVLRIPRIVWEIQYGTDDPILDQLDSLVKTYRLDFFGYWSIVGPRELDRSAAICGLFRDKVPSVDVIEAVYRFSQNNSLKRVLKDIIQKAYATTEVCSRISPKAYKKATDPEYDEKKKADEKSQLRSIKNSLITEEEFKSLLPKDGSLLVSAMNNKDKFRELEELDLSIRTYNRLKDFFHLLRGTQWELPESLEGIARVPRAAWIKYPGIGKGIQQEIDDLMLEYFGQESSPVLYATWATRKLTK